MESNRLLHIQCKTSDVMTGSTKITADTENEDIVIIVFQRQQDMEVYITVIQ